MPQDRGLYGQPPPKKQKKEIAVSSSLAFTAQLTSLLSAGSGSAASSLSSANAAAARPRPSKSKGKDDDKASDLLARTRTKRKAGVDPGEGREAGGGGNKLVLKDVVGTGDDKAELARARRKMEEKARLYSAMKRGDYVPRDGEAAPLVDFDRKWAETQGAADEGGASSSGSDYGDEGEDHNGGGGEDDDDGVDTEQIEYEDEFGRLRRGTRADKERLERRLQRGMSSAAELDRMSARPKAPEKLIYGDAVQVGAFATADADAMEALARKRDRSATPPDALHYEAAREIRTKGVGFYAFSKDEDVRQEEMRGLEAERVRTEKVRREREEAREARRKEVERRKGEMAQRRAKKMADSFLNGLAETMLDGEGDGGERAAVDAISEDVD